MIAIAMFLAASSVPQSLLDASDAAALAQTRCMFATFRAASQAHLSPSDFDKRLHSSCSAQSHDLGRLSARIFALRGEANPSAKSEAMIEESYRTMVEDYRRMPEKEKMIRDICQGDPSPCR